MRYLLIVCIAALALQCTSKRTTPQDTTSTPTPPAGAAGCAPALVGDYLTDKPAPVLPGLDYFKFPITTTSQKAQMYFNQGWALAAGFNHAEAARSFYWASREDPNCAMCYWGLSYVLGPNYNAGMDPTVVSDAVESIKAAQLLSSYCTERERDLIMAMAKRYPEKHDGDRSQYDQDYSQALKALTEKYPKDHDITALYVESVMDLHPWDLWDKEGNPRPWTPGILKELEGVRKQDPNHAIVNHMYIHAVEASFEPSLGYDAADRLADVAPGAGHLVHMPSHIYIRTGDYRECTVANVDAVEVDSVYVSACHAAGAYPLGYYPHNFHFLCACAALEGDARLAYDAALRMQEKLDTEIMRQEGWGTVQHYYTIPYYILVKFELWKEVLDTEMPDEDLKYPRAVLHYARGMAYAGMGQLAKAKEELTALRTIAADEAIQSITIWDINNASDLLEIATYVLEGEIAFRAGQHDAAITSLTSAIVIEDALNYNEPPDWFFSVRHYLGDVYLDMEEWDKAEATFRQDLHTFPKNGWALHGLYKSLKGKGDQSEAERVYRDFEKAWEYANVQLAGSRVL